MLQAPIKTQHSTASSPNTQTSQSANSGRLSNGNKVELKPVESDAKDLFNKETKNTNNIQANNTDLSLHKTENSTQSSKSISLAQSISTTQDIQTAKLDLPPYKGEFSDFYYSVAPSSVHELIKSQGLKVADEQRVLNGATCGNEYLNKKSLPMKRAIYQASIKSGKFDESAYKENVTKLKDKLKSTTAHGHSMKDLVESYEGNNKHKFRYHPSYIQHIKNNFPDQKLPDIAFIQETLGIKRLNRTIGTPAKIEEALKLDNDQELKDIICASTYEKASEEAYGNCIGKLYLTTSIDKIKDYTGHKTDPKDESAYAHVYRIPKSLVQIAGEDTQENDAVFMTQDIPADKLEWMTVKPRTAYEHKDLGNNQFNVSVSNNTTIKAGTIQQIKDTSQRSEQKTSASNGSNIFGESYTLLKKSAEAPNQLGKFEAQRNTLKDSFETLDQLTKQANNLNLNNHPEKSLRAAQKLMSNEFSSKMVNMLYNPDDTKETFHLKLTANRDYVSLLTAAIKEGKINANQALDVLTRNAREFKENQPGYLFRITNFSKNNSPKMANAVADLIIAINDKLPLADKELGKVRMALLAENSYRENKTNWQIVRNFFKSKQGPRDFYSKLFDDGKTKNLGKGAMIIAEKLRENDLLPYAHEVESLISSSRLKKFDRASDNAQNYIKDHKDLVTKSEYNVDDSSNKLASNIKESNVDGIIKNELNKIDQSEKSTKVENQISRFERELTSQIHEIWDKIIKEKKRKLSSNETEFLNTKIPPSLIDECISKAKNHPDFANLMKSQALYNHNGIKPEEIKIKPGDFDNLEKEIAKLDKDFITLRVDSLSDKAVKQAKSDYADFKRKQEQQRQQQLEEQKRAQTTRVASQSTSSRRSHSTSQPNSSFGGFSESKPSSSSTPKSSTTTSSASTPSSVSRPAPQPAPEPKRTANYARWSPEHRGYTERR
ncbi:hypothetical protein [Spartinivicinus ruber]|uniref:hypothetical protein n=1 Tax=Spartinivicinus ruber TaxID=2683272 RepID=UPI0013D8B5FA|nr:hypothetical protein [Spartinivicinus ruber]